MIRTNTKSSSLSARISFLRTIAILSVISAHTSFGSNSSLFTGFSSSFLELYGLLGVLIFFSLSGYLFFNNSRSFKMFMVNKMIYVIIPWISIGTLVYFISSLSGVARTGLSFLDWSLFILGYNSYLYFMTVLFLLYLIFWHFKENKGFIILSILISIISNTLTIIGILTVYPYLNILNWMGYFSVGILINMLFQNKTSRSIFSTSIRFSLFIFTFLVLVFLFILIFTNNYKISYWSISGLSFSFASAQIIILLIPYLTFHSIFDYIGNRSFAIYLIHMPFAGLINIAFINFSHFILLKPIIVLFSSILLIEIILKIGNLFKMQQVTQLLLGVRFQNFEIEKDRK